LGHEAVSTVKDLPTFCQPLQCSTVEGHQTDLAPKNLLLFEPSKNICHQTCCNFPEDTNIHQHCCDNLKSESHSLVRIYARINREREKNLLKISVYWDITLQDSLGNTWRHLKKKELEHGPKKLDFYWSIKVLST